MVTSISNFEVLSPYKAPPTPDLKLPEQKPVEIQKCSSPKIVPFVKVKAKHTALLPQKITAPTRADVHSDSNFKVSEMADAYLHFLPPKF